MKFPNHHPDNAYKLSGIHDTTNHILTGTATTTRPQHIHPNGAALPPTNITTMSNPPPPPAAAPAPQIKTEDFSAILDKFVSTLMTVFAGTKGANNRSNGGLQQDQVENLICIFCGLAGHFISDCLVCQQYITDGKCKHNAAGKVVLMNGLFMPRNIPGHYIKDHINEWLRHNPAPATATPALMYDLATTSTSASTSPSALTLAPVNASQTRSIYQINEVNADRLHITRLEQEIYALRSGRNFA
jgi:hypothetical protein